jgi:uncharacterized protein YndB with AHSA1/START domain
MSLDERTIEVTRIVDAPIDLVFQAFIDPTHLSRWWGPEGFSVRDVVSDPRPGGAFALVMEGPDGIGGPVEGRYLEVEAPTRFVLETSALLPDGSPMLTATSTIDLTAVDGKTVIRVRGEGRALVEGADPALAGMEVGWLQSLRCLEDHVTGTADRLMLVLRLIEAPAERVFDAWPVPDGVTLEVADRPSRLAYGGGPRTSVTFDAYMDATIVVVRLIYDTPSERDGDTRGAAETTAALDRLTDLVTT